MTLAPLFQQRLDAGEIIIMDGGMGSELGRRGAPINPSTTWSAEPNINQPHTVLAIHEDYIRAGAEIIITNTFCTSRSTLAQIGLGDRTADINKKAVALAQDARRNCGVEGSVIIAGSMSSLDPKDQPKVVPSYDAALEEYTEQATALADSGVDIIVLEMFVRAVDASAAAAAAAGTGLPIVVGISCESFEGQLCLGLLGRHSGETIADAVGATISDNVAAFAIMHSPPRDTYSALQELSKHTMLPLAAYAHAGDYEAQTGYAPSTSSAEHASPERYVQYAEEWVALGSQVVGGCCGTTPDHIRALKQNIPRRLPS